MIAESPTHPPVITADVLIIGGGLSGALLAWQLLRRGGARMIVVFEPRAELGRGEAYSTEEPDHTLNANAARMSIDPDAPDDLTHWLTEHLAAGGWPQGAAQRQPVELLFPPRGLFGRYVQERLGQAMAQAPGISVRHVRAEAEDAWPVPGGICVQAGTQRWQAPIAVLATGVFPAARTPRRGSPATAALALDPWDVGRMARLPVEAPVAIVGTGLTMVDGLLSLRRAGHQGPVQVFSRHGLLPQPRRQPPAWPDFLSLDSSLRTPLQLSRALRRQCRLAVSQGVDWQAPLDTVRAHVARLWHQASDGQRRQFVRHLRPWWESHHHRSPPQGAAWLAQLLAEGRLTLEAACLIASEPAPEGLELTVRPRGREQAEPRRFAALIDSSGIEYDWRRVERPLPRQLLARGLVRPGPLGLGIDADPSGAVIGATGQVSDRLLAMGPPLRGLWWESTSVTDVAAQARALALHIAQLGFNAPKVGKTGVSQ